jgi:hypothetical protein
MTFGGMRGEGRHKSSRFALLIRDAGEVRAAQITNKTQISKIKSQNHKLKVKNKILLISPFGFAQDKPFKKGDNR